MRRTSGVLAALVLVAGLVTAGCGHSSGPAMPADPPVDLSALDTGPYKTEPGTFDKPRNIDMAKAWEAERLANVVPLPSEIDPAFRFGGGMSSNVVTDIKGSVITFFWKADNFEEDGPGYQTGFATYGRDDKHNSGNELLNAVLIFDTPDHAAAAATAYEARAFTAPPTDGLSDTPDPTQPANEPVPIAKYPGAHAHWRPGLQALHSWYAFRNFVVYTAVYGQDAMLLHHADRASMVELTTRSLDAETAALQNYTTTPPDKVMDQPTDPDGMLNRTMERPLAAGGDEWLNPPGVYNARAALNFTDDEPGDKEWFDRDGVDRYADYGNHLYRTRDAAAALDARSELGGGSKHFKPAEPPKALPAAICREYRGKSLGTVRFYCAVNYGRYAAMSWGNQLLDAQQRIAAQYVILVKAK